MRVAIIGAGAAGTFCAIRIKEELKEQGLNPEEIHVSLFEKGRVPLRKVKISGGGRCNVTHALFTPKEFSSNYPRGHKELIGPFHQFLSGDMLGWLEDHGVPTKIEEDGRIFPESNNSQSIIDCFQRELDKYSIPVVLSKTVADIAYENEKFLLTFNKEESETFDKVLIATGSDKAGHFLATSLGHSITDLAPSLFTFKVNSPLLRGLEGISFQSASVKIKTANQTFQSQGPLLITHWGLSGPAILKLSAWAARELKGQKYQFRFHVNFLEESTEKVFENLKKMKTQNGPKKLQNVVYQGLTKRFWERLVSIETEKTQLKWSEVSEKLLQTLAENLTAKEFMSAGSHRFKEEFVECGGVDCKEVDFKGFESKLIPGLHFAGEILDIDGVTGGFNFQNAWTGAYLAAKRIVSK